MDSDVATLAAVSAPSDWSAFIIAALAIVALVGVGFMSRTCRRIARRLSSLEMTVLEHGELRTRIEASHAEFAAQTQRSMHALEERNAALVESRMALQTTNQRLQRLVAVDALTGIANRRQFDRSLDRELRRARRDGQPLSLIFLDLDEFKRFNDTYGHARGDDVLRKVAHTLNETFRRGGDLVARYGGEEFAVILPGVDARRAALYAERLRRRIWRLAIPHSAAHAVERVTLSGGVATVPPSRIATPHELLSAADEALYRAKCLGRNQIASAALITASDTAAEKAAS
jgi:diguanylate cyclase